MSKSRVAIWVITPNGVGHAESVASAIDVDLFVSGNYDVIEKCSENTPEYRTFETLRQEVEKQFYRYSGHVFIMSSGIVVRMIAPLIRSKTSDPAVVVLDDRARHSISLLSGHIGGANVLAKEVARATGAKPVITTATDVNDIKAIDVISLERELVIENPDLIKNVNMALLTGKNVRIYDPLGILADTQLKPVKDPSKADVIVDDRVMEVPPDALMLRPGSLVAGIGCNRGTEAGEISELLANVLDDYRLSAESLYCIATIDIKQDEEGLLELGEALSVPIVFFAKEALESVETIITPSEMVEKHIGVKSVCEAAAILAARQGELIVTKKKTPNVTVALARMSFTSSG